MIVYDITSRVSFDQVKEYWIHELRHQCFGSEGLQIAIIGNKAGIHHIFVDDNIDHNIDDYDNDDDDNIDANLKKT